MNGRLEAINKWSELAAQAHWNVAELAVLCGVSVPRLERHILKTTGVRPHDWMTELRMQQALTDVQKGDSVKRAAAKAGYQHAQHFSRDFK